MIYLLKSPSWNPNYVMYKVGYTSNIWKRLKQYEPETSLVASRPGDEIDEKVFHLRMRLLPGLIKIHRKEWYVVKKTDYQIREVFHEPKELMEKTVWYATSLKEIPGSVSKYLTQKYN